MVRLSCAPLELFLISWSGWKYLDIDLIKPSIQSDNLEFWRLRAVNPDDSWSERSCPFRITLHMELLEDFTVQISVWSTFQEITEHTTVLLLFSKYTAHCMQMCCMHGISRRATTSKKCSIQQNCTEYCIAQCNLLDLIYHFQHSWLPEVVVIFECFFSPLTNQFSTNSLSLVLSTALIAWKIRTFLDRGLPDWVDQWNRLWGGICAFLTDYLIGCQMLNSMWKDIHNVFSFQNLISRIFNKKKRKKKKLRGTLINWELFLIVKCRCCQNVIRWLERICGDKQKKTSQFWGGASHTSRFQHDFRLIFHIIGLKMQRNWI